METNTIERLEIEKIAEQFRINEGFTENANIAYVSGFDTGRKWQYDKLKEERDRYEKAIVSLTPSGSEFVYNPEYCAKYVKEFEASQHKLICDLVIEKKKLTKERDLLIEALRNMVMLNDSADRNLTKEWKEKSKSAKTLLLTIKS